MTDYAVQSTDTLSTKLPVNPVKADKSASILVSRINGILKRNISNMVRGQPDTFNDDIYDLVLKFGNERYSKGLAHMDAMHAKANEL
jgi:hypothetical protein